MTARGAVAVPDLTPGTTWLVQVQRLLFDAEAESILALQPRPGNVVEFSPNGEFMRDFGGVRGEGPGEIRQLTDFAVSPSAVALLDRGNQRVLLFDRSGALSSEFRVAPRHRAIAFFRDQIALVPGGEGRAVDLLSATGTFDRAIALSEDLPVRCDAEGCGDLNRLCIGCQLVSVRDHLLVVNLEQAIITALDAAGDVAWKMDFQSDDPVVSAWVAADEPLRARMQEEEANRSPSQLRTEVFKSYFLGASGINGRVILAVVPSAAVLQVDGFELWEMDATDGSYERYRYPRTGVGFFATGLPSSGVYAVSPADGGVYAFVADPS